MTRTNLELQSEMIAAFNEGGIEATLGYYAEDAEVYDPDLPDGGTYRGREGVRHMLELMMSGNETTEVIDYRVLPVGDRVVTLTHTKVKGKPGLPDVEVRDAHVHTWRDGKVVYWRMYTDQDEVFGDVGLDPADVPGRPD